MISSQPSGILKVVLCVVACLIHLSGCTRSKNSSSDKVAEPAVTTKETLTEYPLSNGTLRVITVPRCQIIFKQPGVPDFVKNFGDGAAANVIFSNPNVDGAKVSGPDALIEWSFEGGRTALWSLSTHPVARVTNTFCSSVTHFQISENTPKTFVITGDVVFDDLGGAHQVIVPMTFAWQKSMFVIVPHKKGRARTNAELKQKALECQSIVESAAGDTVSPELAEAVLCLYANGDKAGSKKLLHYGLGKHTARVSGCWRFLMSAYKSAGQDTNQQPE